MSCSDASREPGPEPRARTHSTGRTDPTEWDARALRVPLRQEPTMDARETTADHPAKMIPAKPTGSSKTIALDEAAKARLYRQHVQGTSIQALAEQMGRSQASVLRMVNEVRARRLLDMKLDAMPNPSFDERSARAEILAPMPP